MGNFFAELKRRHIYRVAAAYVVVAWVALQVVNNVAPVFDLPSWIARGAVLFLALGFPVALLLVWMFEGRTASAAAPIRVQTHAADWILSGALIVVIALVSYQQLSTPGARTEQQASIASSASPAQPAAISIAVLPFANLSGDASQEFFSDGMSEEIMTALAKVSALRIIGRESSFQFKGQQTNNREIGQALGAGYLIEGAVRKEGARVRITARLVQAETGVSLWTDSFDRELASVFTTQEEIAEAIAGALRVPLGLKQGESLIGNRTSNEAAYEDYLRAKSSMRVRGADNLRNTERLLQQVIARDPAFARAWGLLAENEVLLTVSTVDSRSNPQQLQTGFDRAERNAAEALRLDSGNVDAQLALADIQRYRGNWEAAEALFRQALALEPNDADVLHRNALRLADVGHVKESLAIHRRIQVLEPSLEVNKIGVAQDLLRNGQFAASIAILEPLAAGNARNLALARAYAWRHEYGKAADLLLAIPDRPNDLIPRPMMEDAAHLLRSAPARAAPTSLPREELPPSLNFIFAHVGADDSLLAGHERRVPIPYMTALSDIWTPEYAAVRKTERFKALVRKAGLVDYWRARGWPEFCHPTTGDNFECN